MSEGNQRALLFSFLQMMAGLRGGPGQAQYEDEFEGDEVEDQEQDDGDYYEEPVQSAASKRKEEQKQQAQAKEEAEREQKGPPRVLNGEKRHIGRRAMKTSQKRKLNEKILQQVRVFLCVACVLLLFIVCCLASGQRQASYGPSAWWLCLTARADGGCQ